MAIEDMKNFPEDAKREELMELAYKDQADTALEEALKLRIPDVVQYASRAILCSGSYSEEDQLLAARNNWDDDLKDIRKKILSRKK